MQGGVAGNVVAETASAEVTIRVAAGAPEDTKDLIEQALKAVDPKHLEVEWRGGGYGPVPIDSDVEGKSTAVVSEGFSADTIRFRSYYSQLR